MADYAPSLLTSDSGFGGARQDSVTRKGSLEDQGRDQVAALTQEKKKQLSRPGGNLSNLLLP